MTDGAVSFDPGRRLVIGEIGLAGMDQTLDNPLRFHKLVQTPFPCEPGIGERCFDPEKDPDDTFTWRCQVALNLFRLPLDRFAFKGDNCLLGPLVALDGELINRDFPSQSYCEPVIDARDMEQGWCDFTKDSECDLIGLLKPERVG